MSNANFKYFASLATASALAITSNGVIAHSANPEDHSLFSIRYEHQHTSPSNNSQSLSIVMAGDSLKERVADFYAQLSASQVSLEPELEQALLENLSYLYED